MFAANQNIDTFDRAHGSLFFVEESPRDRAENQSRFHASSS
jgi:hypothetical protein